MGELNSINSEFNISKIKVDNEDKTIITILPGSRKNEVSKLLPIFLESAQKLWEENPNLFFVLPTVKTVSNLVKSMTADCLLPLQVVETQAERYSAFRASEVAIAASGTVALELAICHIPHLVGYKVSPFTAWIVSKIMKIQFVNLSNIMLGRQIVPELLQEQCISGNIVRTTNELLAKKDLYELQMYGFAKVKQTLSNGEQIPSDNAADFILQKIKSRKI